MKTDILIIGNGIAGLSCAEEIRKKDIDLEIMIISREKYPTYYRVRLTEALARDIEIDDILVKKEDWYRNNNIDLKLNTIVEKILYEDNKVVLENREEIEYDRLVLAMGSRAFIPPVKGRDKQGVFAIRDYDDLLEVRDYMRDRKKVAVIGGGLLGLEAAWAFKTLGKEVHIVELAENILPRQLNLEMSKKLEGDLEKEGLILHLGQGVEKIFGKNSVEGLELSNGERIDAELVLFSVGVRGEIDLVESTDLKYNKGIEVDRSLSTNLERVYAAGDVIEFEDRTLGLWTSSMEQGRILGKNIVGANLEYTSKIPFTTLKLGSNIDVFSIGENSTYDEIYKTDRPEEDIYERVFIKDGNLIGGILYGSSRKMISLKKAVERGLGLKEYLEG